MRKSLLALTMVAFIVVVGIAMAQPDSGAPSIADVARQVRKTPRPPAKRTLTNDDAPNLVSAAQPASAANNASAEANPEVADGKPTDPVGKANALKAEWKLKIDAQRKIIADLEAESSKGDEELRQRSSAAYADLGIRLRNQQGYLDDNKKIRDDAAKRQGKLAEARAELDRLEEEARKAGVEGSLD